MPETQTDLTCRRYIFTNVKILSQPKIGEGWDTST